MDTTNTKKYKINVQSQIINFYKTWLQKKSKSIKRISVQKLRSTVIARESVKKTESLKMGLPI